MGYNEELAAISRTPIALVELDLHTCSRTFGTAPCNATGVPCYNTKATCRYASAYNRQTTTYQFTSANASVIPFAGPRPYLDAVSALPTEIKTTITASGRATATLHDEPDDGPGLDPYFASRNAAAQGTYWRNLLTRNPHYKGRTARILQGFTTLARNEFVEVWRGTIDNITVARGVAKVEIVDTMKALDKAYVPPKVSCKLVADMNTTTTYATVTDAMALGLGCTMIDPGFESGARHWCQGDNATVVTNNNARSGNGCVTFNNAGGWISCFPPRACRAGDTLFVLGWHKITGNGTGTASIGAAFYDANQTWLSTAYHNNNNGAASSTAWTEATGTLTVPANAAFYQPTVAFAQNNAVGWIDDVLLFSKTDTYVRLGDELVRVDSASYTNQQLSGLTRACLGTSADNHSAGEKVQPVRVYPPANPFAILREVLLVDGALLSTNYNATAFNDAAVFPGDELVMQGVVAEPTKASDLYYELVDLLDCKSWVGEDLAVTIRHNLPNRPGRTPVALTDEANVVVDSTALDLNQKSRLSRFMLYWNKPAISKLDAYTEYQRLDGAADAEAESPDEYGERAEKVVGSRWLDPALATEEELDAFLLNFTMRRVWLYRDPQPLLKCEVELKDSGVKTGDYVTLTTDEVPTISGGNSTGTWEVVKREPKANKVTLTLLRCKPERLAYIAANNAPDYNNATATQRNDYCYLGDADGTISGDPGYYLW